jgi:hypothetical protein
MASRWNISPLELVARRSPLGDLEVVVVRPGHQGREHFLEPEPATERRVVDVILHDGQEIQEPRRDAQQLTLEFRQDRRQALQTLLLELVAVGNHGTGTPACFHQPPRQLRPRIVRSLRKELDGKRFVVLREGEAGQPGELIVAENWMRQLAGAGGK